MLIANDIVERALLKLRQYKQQETLPWITEWLLSWFLLTGFSCWYLAEFALLQCVPRVSSEQRSRIPLTTLPRTRQERKKTWLSKWEEFSKLLGPNESEDDVLSLLRSNLRARQLASSLVTSTDTPNEMDGKITETIAILYRIWSRALQMIPPTGQADYSFTISLVIPAFRERIENIHQVLRHTWEQCQKPSKVQVVIVDAGGNICSTDQRTDNPEFDQVLLDSYKTSNQRWGDFRVVSYKGKGGRGGCMNRGAQESEGRIITFLHSDTLLPKDWDASVCQAIPEDNHKRTKETTLCAFNLGFDESIPCSKIPGVWGAHKILAFIRCSVCKLPYGDSALSFPSYVWNYLGGFPFEQPLMEDYDIVQLLRKRSRILSTTSKKERIVILQDSVKASLRRWQQYGVPYVILSNAYCIYRHLREQATSEDLFEFYYSQNKGILSSKVDNKVD